MHAIHSYRSCLLLAALAAGCAAPPAPSPAPDEIAAPAPGPEYVPVVRYGRYTLVELTPTAAQQYLLLQVVDVSIPGTLHANVGDALRHVLQRSGYQLCSGRNIDALGDLPLPAAHYHLGPLQLRDALLTLAGPARTLHVDHSTRSVCFSQQYKTPAEATPANADSAPLQGAAGELQP